MLQFTTEALEQVCFTSEMFIEVTNLVDVSDVVGVLLIPKRWPAGLAIQKNPLTLLILVLTKWRSLLMMANEYE